MNLVPLCSLQENLTWLVVPHLKTWVHKEWLCASLLLETFGSMTLGLLTHLRCLSPSQDSRCLTWVKRTSMILLHFLRLTLTRPHKHHVHFMFQRNQLHRNEPSTSWLTCRSAAGAKLVSCVSHDRIIRRKFDWSNLYFSATIASSLIRKSKDPSRFLTFVMWCPDLHLLVSSPTKDILCTPKVNFVGSYLKLDGLLVSRRLILSRHLLHLQRLWLPNLEDLHFAKVPLNGNKRRERLATASNFSTHRWEHFDRTLLIGTAHLFRSLLLSSLGLWNMHNSCWTTLQSDPMAWLRLNVVGANAILRRFASLVRLCCVDFAESSPKPILLGSLVCGWEETLPLTCMLSEPLLECSKQGAFADFRFPNKLTSNCWRTSKRSLGILKVEARTLTFSYTSSSTRSSRTSNVARSADGRNFSSWFVAAWLPWVWENCNFTKTRIYVNFPIY